MTTQQPVLAATDFSNAADEALRQAHAEARHRRTRLVVCHVLPDAARVRVLFPHEAGPDLPAQAALEDTARETLRLKVAEVLGHPAVPIQLHVAAGSAPDGILDVAGRVGAALIVTGPGHSAVRIARAARVPLLVARPSPEHGPVIGATDFSSPAVPAIADAVATAAASGNPLVVMHCLDIDPAAAMAAAGAVGAVPLPAVPDDIVRDMTADSVRQLDDALARFGAAGRALVLQAPPARGIVHSAHAEGASLVVVGTHGRSGLVRLLLGSVSEYVVAHAPCSVRTVPLFPPAPQGAKSRAGVPGVARLARQALVALTTVALLAMPSPGAAQNPATRGPVASLVELMARAKLDAFALREEGDVYLSVMYVKGVQLLVVRARHPVPAALDARIAAGDFQGAYADHNGSTLRDGKLFVMDMGADGLVPRPARGTAFDIAYEDGVRETRFDGDWRRQGLSEEDYRLRVADIEHRYSSMLNVLTDALRRRPL